jgi:hypothetical protein
MSRSKENKFEEGQDPKDVKAGKLPRQTPPKRKAPRKKPEVVIETWCRPVVKMTTGDYTRIKMLCLKNGWTIGDKLREVLMEWVVKEEKKKNI